MPELLPLAQPTRSLFWTAPAFDASEMTSEDPLGLDYVAQQVGMLLLPTFTTRSNRAQAYAMVLYGLDLARRAAERYRLPQTDTVVRQLFERWERFWALAALESRGGDVARGDWDAMRGIRGAKAAWRPGDSPMPLDFALISRQQELGNLGAYLAPLRRSRLVTEGTVRPALGADEIVTSFWDEPGENRNHGQYDEYALTCLDPERDTVPRKQGHLTLRKVGERSRLTALRRDERGAQRRRLYAALFEQPRDATTLAVAGLVEAAARKDVMAPREILTASLGGRLGKLDEHLHDLVTTARAFGDLMRELLATFDRMYRTIDDGGLAVARDAVVTAAFADADMTALRAAGQALLAAPSVAAIRSFPMHGAACLRLAAELVSAPPSAILDSILAYHGVVQRERRRGGSWIKDDGRKLFLAVTSYTPRGENARFPSFKLDAVRVLLMDTGRLAFPEAEEAPGAVS